MDSPCFYETVHRAALTRILSVLLTFLALTTACGKASTPTLAPSTGEDESPTSCEDGTAPAFCSQITRDGEVIRYAIASPPEPEGAILLDLGGPGYPLMGTFTFANVGAQLPESVQNLAVIAIEEPWATAGVTDACKTATTAFLKSVRDLTSADNKDQAGQELRTSCEVGAGKYGWSPEHYANAVDAVLEAEGLDLRGVVGISFGAQRVSYLTVPSDVWFALDSPSDSTPTASQHLQNLADRVGSRLATTGFPNGPADLSQTVGALSAQVEKRSVPVTAIDIGPASIAAARLPESGAAAAIFSDDPDLELIGELSDYTWGRMGQLSLSPAYLAYLDEVCRSYSDWDDALAADDPNRDPVSSFLVDFHRPCLGTQTFSEPTSYRTPDTSCIVYSESDPFSGEAISNEWAKRLDATLIERPGNNHGTNDLSLCFEIGLDK